MGVLDRAYIRVANDVVHDVAAAAAMALPFASLIVRRYASGAGSIQLARATWPLVVGAIVALGFIVATGGVRLRYAALGVRANYVSARARGALVKHACFVSVVVAGMVSAFFAARS